jgi:hypothetical protein
VTPIPASNTNAIAAAAPPNQRWNLPLATLGDVVSVTDLTIAAGWMAGLAIVALVFSGWRQNARAIPRTPRAEPKVRRPRVPIGIAESTTPLYKTTNPLRRIWAAVASAGIGIAIGVVSAILIAFGSAYAVVTLTDLLKS